MKITVLMGGASAERDVSLASGARITAALKAKGHDVTAFDPATGEVLDVAAVAKVKTEPPSREELARLAAAMSPAFAERPEVREADVVFLALHGGAGEDGTVQALLDLAGARYTGSGHLASALAMDKELSKHLFRAFGVVTAEWMMVRDGEPLPDVSVVERRLGMPVIVKPSKQGSTVGLTLVKRREDLAPAIEEARKYDDEVMLETFVPGRELTVGVIGVAPVSDALPVGEIIPAHELYDYECKYTAGMATEVFPADLTAGEARRVQSQARLAFAALKLRGCARIDFRMTPEGEFYCLEANTLPGMTELSLIPQAAAAAGITFPDMCERIARLALGEDSR